MMKKKIDSPFRKLKMLAVLPVAAFLFYAFATPEYQFGNDISAVEPQAKIINVKGTVLKSDGSPLPGTSVILKGSTLGTMSGPEGKFELKGVPSDGELYFSFVGFKTKVQKVSGDPMKIEMEVSKVGIDEIVVVGYGTPPPPPLPPPPSAVHTSKGFDSANPPSIFLDGVPISKATMDKLDPETFESISVLKDKAAIEKYGKGAKNGVILIKLKDKYSSATTGNTNQKEKGSNEPVFVVGYGQMTSGQTPNNLGYNLTVKDGANPPLIILDGVPVDKKAMDQINPNDIESISVLKDKSATAVYGEKGKNGVILITSKKAALNNFDPAKPPLYLLDGTETDKKTIDQVSPATIERMFIMKDPSITASYGEKGKNGVILIYTKEYKLNNPEKFQEAIRKMVKPAQREDGVYVVVEEMPEFPGKEIALRNFIAENIKYPVEAKEKGIQGKVYVTFVVNSTGKVEKAKIARGVDPLLDAEALRVVEQLPEWKPGRQKGEAVNVSYTIPIMFALDGGKDVKQTASFVLPIVNESKGEKQVFIVVEEMPEFPGGEIALRNFLARAVKYPAEAQKNKSQGKVYVSFVVNSEGKVEQPKIEKSVDPLLDAEAIRVIGLVPDWKPGKQRGVAVSVAYTIPIQFKLE